MTLRSRPAAGLAALVGAFLLLDAPALQGQIRWELGPQGVATLAHPALVAGGLYGAYRPGWGGRVRLGLSLAAGSQDGVATGRGEVSFHFLLSPGRPRGVSLYGLGGLAAVIGRADRGFLMVGLGLESSPGARAGWGLEAGVGGGARLALGYRWRWRVRP
jgi:hypothetical protein